MTLREILLFNPILLAALIAWSIAQILKVLIEFILLRRWNWALLFQAGGMPSSHSAMVSAAALSIGLYVGFDQPVFAISSILAMIVIYDATGIRRETGRQAVLNRHSATRVYPVASRHRQSKADHHAQGSRSE